MKQFSEATRVQMPAMVHLTRIGYTYFGKLSEDKNGTVYDGDTNILLPVFEQQFKKLNPGHEGEWMQVLKDIRKELNDDDLGRGFYNRLKVVSPVKLIDFDNIENNTFHFTAEFTCKNGQDEFRPDITLFVNGLPLCFVEVKKPNNHGGMLAESARMNKERFPNKKFRRFINITQLMIFSNNMEYDALGGIVPIQGAFYCTGARTYSPFNCFREENPSGQKIAPYHHDYPYKEIDRVAEKKILSDYNCQVIHTSPEYQTNLDFNTPTNRILTSMCSPERLLYIIRYGIAYVRMEREVDGKIESTDQKHIMRYQQLFASLAIRKKLAEGIKSGVVWHTQGSGKTALSYYLTYILNDFYSKQNKVAKFYFIVDRLDLLEQATQEFEARGLVVSTANTRAELMEQFRSNQAQQGTSGQAEITKLPQLLSEVQRRIGIINQKEAFSIGDETKTLINEAMMDIEFTFSKIGQEEMRLISGGAELKEKWQRTIASFTQNFDQDDPEFMSLRDAFMERFKEHGFVIDSIAKFNEETQALDEIITRLQDLQKRNNALVKKYKGDEKFARVHKRIREVNKQREEKGQKPMFSFLDDEIVAILNIIKEDVDAKVYDRNDILKKDAYFGRTVMALINGCLYHFPQIRPEMDDYKFIQQRISQQYINQYNATYGMA